jgi:predicted lipoprotein with Yx(FWY)xxD motif
MNKRWLVPAGLVAAALIAAGCGSSGGSGSTGGGGSGNGQPASHTKSAGASSGNAVKAAKISGAMVLTNAQGFTLYWFAPDTSTTSKCNGACATFWPPVKGPATGSGIHGTFGTITRSDGSTQATFDGHPLYTYQGDTAPGQAKGNGLNVNGGVWHEVTVTGGGAPASNPSSSPATSGGGGSGY